MNLPREEATAFYAVLCRADSRLALATETKLTGVRFDEGGSFVNRLPRPAFISPHRRAAGLASRETEFGTVFRKLP